MNTEPSGADRDALGEVELRRRGGSAVAFEAGVAGARERADHAGAEIDAANAAVVGVEEVQRVGGRVDRDAEHVGDLRERRLTAVAAVTRRAVTHQRRDRRP